MASFDIFAPPLPAEAHHLQWPDQADAEAAVALLQAARQLQAQRQAPMLVITQDSAEADQLRRELLSFGADPSFVYTLPDWETLPYDSFSPHQDIVSERLNALYHLPELQAGILVVPVNSLMHRLPPP